MYSVSSVVSGEKKRGGNCKEFSTSGARGLHVEEWREQGGKTKGLTGKKYSLAQDITVPQSFRKQPPFSIFSHRASATSTKPTKTSNRTPNSVGNPISVGAAALSPHAL